jgi:hypothetical protein
MKTPKGDEVAITTHDSMQDVAERLRTQDNRCTAEPMFCLQIKVRDIGYDPNYSEGQTVWVDMSGEHDEVPPESEGAEEFGYKDRWETVMVAFTEQGLLDYMELDGHNVKRRAYNGETRIYVESFRRCEEMIRIRKHLLDGRDGKDVDEFKKLLTEFGDASMESAMCDGRHQMALLEKVNNAEHACVEWVRGSKHGATDPKGV